MVVRILRPPRHDQTFDMASQATNTDGDMKATSSKTDRFLGLLGIKKTEGKKEPAKHHSGGGGGGYDMPKSWTENLDEVADPMPVENRDDNAQTYTHHTLEEQHKR